MKKAFALACLASALFGTVGLFTDAKSVSVGEEQLVKLTPHHPHPHPHPRPDHEHHYRHPDDAKRQAMVDHVNSLKTTWTAGLNKRFLGRPLDAIKRQLGVPELKVPAHKRLPRKVHTGFDIAAIPASFDSRTQWPNCPTIQEIRDQSDCGSCWAFGAVEAASDRICIGTKGAVNAHLSAEDLLSCCSSCGDGCNGGDPGSAWQYLASTGVVTGGNYNDFSWCSSYSMPNCEHHNNHTTYPACGGTEYSTPACPTACDAQSTYSVPFAKDAHVFASAYSIGSDPAQIQQEIITNGPVEVAFQVYSDFEQYTGGVYQHVSGDFLGGHAVKMIGWGVTDDGNNTPYWIIANSWNNDWGENGFFRILRGQDECGIEDSVVAGIFQSSKAEAEVKKAVAVAAPATTKTNCESGVGVPNMGVGCTYWQCNNAGTGRPSAGCARDFQVHNAPCFSKCAGLKGRDEYFPCLARCEDDDYWSEKCNLHCNQCYGSCPVGDAQCEAACLNAGMSPYPQVVPSSTYPFI